MGNGRQTFDDIEAANMLLRRSYPEIENGSQTGPIFIPETFIPEKYTRGVDPDNILERLEQLYSPDDTSASSYSKYKNMSEELAAFKGTYTERIFYDELRRVLKGSRAVVLHGTEMMLPQNFPKSGGRQESDFLIINRDYKYIMSLELKYSLFSKSDSGVRDKDPSIQKGLKQISIIKTIFETFFGNDIDLSDWRFVGVLGYVKMADHVKCCSDCKPFVVKTSEIEKLIQKFEHDAIAENDEDYKLIIKNILFTIFANPGPIVRWKMDEKTFEKIQEQGSFSNVLFWNPSQFDLIQFYSNQQPLKRNVLFTSSYSTGKTEVIRAMIEKLLRIGQKCHFIVFSFHTDKKPILLLQMELIFEKLFEENKDLRQFKGNIQFSVAKNCRDSLSTDLKELSDLIGKVCNKRIRIAFTLLILMIFSFSQFPDHHTFVDEMVVNIKTDDESESMMRQILKQTKVWLKVIYRKILKKV